MENIASRLDEFISRRMQEDNIPSVVLALTDADRTLHVTSHGFADVAAQVSARPDTLYETGSIGKSFTSIALLQLQDEGKIDIHAPVTDYLPWFAVRSRFDPITLHHLMSHTAGIIRGTDFTPDPRFEVWALRDTETSHPPGEKFHYSNAGYKALGLLLERIEGKPYAEIIQERVLDPLGMDSTVATVTNAVRPRMAVGYTRLVDDGPTHRDDPLVPATWFQTNTADGCLASSVLDLATYLRLYMNGGVANGATVISPDHFSTMTGRIARTGSDDGADWYGYGIRTTELNGQRLIGHGGGMVGYFSDMSCLPEAGFGAVAMVNGIGDPGEFTGYALRLVQASIAGETLPAFPDPVDPASVRNAEDYAGTYAGEPSDLEVIAKGDRLHVSLGGVQAALEPRGEDRFFVVHPVLRRHSLSFGRDGSGKVVEAFHGNSWYRSERYSGPEQPDSSGELAPYAGDYRSHNPWYPFVRVNYRKGRLTLGNQFEPLVQLADGSFALGDTPERITFDVLVDGQPLRMTYAGNAFYRFFTGDVEA